MANVIGSLTMSVDGFIALPDDSVGHLVDWYESGEVALAWPGMGMVSHVTPDGAGYLRDTQALDLGLVDEIAVDLAPVLPGEGIRFFGELANAPLLLDDPEVIQGSRVTHLRFRVRRTTAG